MTFSSADMRRQSVGETLLEQKSARSARSAKAAATLLRIAEPVEPVDERVGGGGGCVEIAFGDCGAEWRAGFFLPGEVGMDLGFPSRGRTESSQRARNSRHGIFSERP